MFSRRIILGVVVLVLLGVSWVGYSLFVTWRGIPDAYAAWDAGTLIIEYLETHDGQWPRSWNELDTARETLEQHGRILRGSSVQKRFIYGDIRTRVAIDWDADPKAIKQFDWEKSRTPLRVVTRADGKEFPVTWARAEPNRMIWRYLNGRTPD